MYVCNYVCNLNVTISINFFTDITVAHKSSLSRHQKAHHNPFKCEYCGAKFDRRQRLDIHRRVHVTAASLMEEEEGNRPNQTKENGDKPNQADLGEFLF